jgi:cytochrome c553
MAKFLIILSIASALIFVSSLVKNQKLPINNSNFNFEEYKKAHEEKNEILEKMGLQHAGGVSAEAEPEKAVEVKIVLETEEEKNGQVSYDKRCVVCHGKMGEGKKSQNAPKLGGQYDWYVYSQLVAMKEKRRINKVMEPYLKPLSDKDFKELSAYIAKLPW